MQFDTGIRWPLPSSGLLSPCLISAPSFYHLKFAIGAKRESSQVAVRNKGQ